MGPIAHGIQPASHAADFMVSIMAKSLALAMPRENHQFSPV
jgi:hypothetical protein